MADRRLARQLERRDGARRRATGAGWTTGSLLGAHLALNLGGWLGSTIVGTLHTFFPSLTQTRLRFAALERPTFACWTAGVALLAVGFAVPAGALVVAGWAALTAAAGLLSANLVASLRAAPSAPGLSARLLAIAPGCLLVALAVALACALAGDPTAGLVGAARAGVATLLLAGWLGLTVAGSLLHLLALIARVRDLTRPLPGPRPGRDRALCAAAVVGVGALAGARADVVAAVEAPALAIVLGAYAVLAGLVLVRLARALGGRAGPVRAP